MVYVQTHLWCDCIAPMVRLNYTYGAISLHHRCVCHRIYVTKKGMLETCSNMPKI